jgi:small-conductance mechanosensitive channel
MKNNVYRELLRKGTQMKITDSQHLHIQAIDAEVQQLQAVLDDYTTKLKEGLDHIRDLYTHIALLQNEKANILAGKGIPQ